ncbi:lysine exporter LysO family protein [Porphyromonas levii]|uniref:Lysine exporter LysO family protein n=1 Tax=Porphyromonas levii TaxID=28114 RepID=A0A4Y8WNZ0_9PORP|nr:lysine exporter LysO family protein [Porphyromonas levii]MBR8702881.1 Lysine exporter LysO [Porphyromonas levii]MBR8712565.1 Lysine exporter LysO [Porphyromonas levii]MBR8714557.1 Lysine exporter LysO [Porphyromonas levii]MBR8727162.1 Lysine exporter LysO [Porphyromonas levii]MBR8730411.1 Lysine exporter LysO [Porphyromonas levii]
MRDNFILLGCFFLGLVLGIYELIPPQVIESDLSNYLLYLLMFTVGMSVGNDAETLKGFRKLPKRIVTLPFLSIVGSLLGGVAAALILGGSFFSTMAIASGQAYYSLSSIIITERLGIALGAIALLANVIRELLTIVLAPMLAKYIGPLAPIAAGGATTMDVTLAPILRASGAEYLVPSIYHGFVCDFSVPILVTLFVGLV